ncbi:MAG: DUF2142 domain-containing protein [Clostridia bacterium]|nr:DUF2142 domain-containing protein [Clostridia bacterium]
MINRIKNSIMANKKFSISFIILSIITIIYFNYDLVFTASNVPDFWKSIFSAFSIVLTMICFIVSMYVISEKKIYKQFLILSIVIGLSYSIVVPLMKGTDDFPHFYRVVELSEGNIIGNEDITIPKDFRNLIASPLDSSNILDKLFKEVDYSQRDAQYTNSVPSSYSPVQYIPQLIGFWLARLLKLGPYMYGLLAKFFNLIYFVICITFAIKLIPFKKQFLFILLLSPAVLSLVGTMTCDSVIFGTSILFISYIFNIKYNNIKITNSNLIILLVLGIIIALSKSVYAPICGILLLLIDKKTDKKDIIKIITIILICAVISVSWFVISNCGKDTISEIEVVEKEQAQTEFVKNNILEYVFINIRLFVNDGYYYLSNLVGGAEMCYSQARIPTLIIFMYLLLLIRSYLSDNKNLKLNIIQKTLVFCIVSFIILVSCYVMYTQWTILYTEIGDHEIIGVQSRYFIEILPLIMLLFNNKKDYEIDNNKLVMPCVYLNMCCIMSIFITMIAGRFTI